MYDLLRQRVATRRISRQPEYDIHSSGEMTLFSSDPDTPAWPPNASFSVEFGAPSSGRILRQIWLYNHHIVRVLES